MKSLADSISGRLLGRLAKAVYHYPRWFLYPQLVLVIVCIFYTVAELGFQTDRNALVGAEKRYHHNFLEFKKEFPAQDDLVVVVESEDTEKNRQFVERLGAKLEKETDVFADVFYKGDLRMLGPKALLFVPEENLVELRQALRQYRPFIEQFATATNLNGLFERINSQFRTSKRELNAETQSLLDALPVLERIVSQATHCIDRPGTPPSPGVNALFGAGEQAEESIYITFPGGRIYLVTARSAARGSNAKAVERLRELVSETRQEVPGLNVGVTGEPVLELDEMAQSQSDTTIASVVSLIGCALVFIYGYRETGRPIKATACLIVGLAYTMGFATLAVGHLNILTITFVPILIGLAIDFGVHLVTRYEEELRHGHSPEAAITKAMVFTGQGIFTGALTTGGAFLAMALTDFQGIREMGIICGGGILICLVPMMTLLPVLLLRGQQNVMDHELDDQVDTRARIEQLWLRRPVTVAVITTVLCALALAQFRKVYFDYNLLNLQSKGLAAVEYEEKLIHSTGKSVIYAAVIADTLSEAVEYEARLRALPTVTNVESMSRRLAEDQTRKLELIGEIKMDLIPIRFAETDPASVQLEALSGTLWSLQGYLGAAAADNEVDDKLRQELLALRSAIVQLRKQMFAGDARVAAAKLAAYQQAFFTDVHETFLALQHQDNRSPLRQQDLPPALKNRFIGTTGKYLLQVYPKENVWQRDKQEAFIRELRQSLDPQDSNKPVITGTPIQLYEYTTLLKKSYEEAAWYALAAISLMVLVHFRSLLFVVLALVPVAIGTVWMVGLMGMRDVPFNPANIMTLPLVIGIGVTNGIHILNRFVEEHNPGILAKSTGKAVLVSGLTTIIGFGSLMLGKHRGIESLGFVMSIGVATCMIAALTFLPALLNLLVKHGVRIKKPSGDNARSTLGWEEPR